MPTYIGLYTWTDQGVKNVKDTVRRVEEARVAFEQRGARLIAAYWTQGRYDLVSIAEFPDEETASASALALGMAGNVHTETMRAFSAEEMQRIIQKLP
ncbi:MAG: GYD domain-containing protein [Chloroflexi bacterium]|nr:MAG: GYD domain-containing protein [Chloroflexota bacterium]